MEKMPVLKNNMKRIRILSGMLFGAFVLACCSVQGEPCKDGDRVVFLGDSITDHGGYIRYLQDFYAT